MLVASPMWSLGLCALWWVQGQQSGYARACWHPTKKRGSWCTAELVNKVSLFK